MFQPVRLDIKKQDDRSLGKSQRSSHPELFSINPTVSHERTHEEDVTYMTSERQKTNISVCQIWTMTFSHDCIVSTHREVAGSVYFDTFLSETA